MRFMKYFFFTMSIALVFSNAIFSQSTKPNPAPKSSTYDPALAKKVGADDYGMKTYILVNLKTGPADAKIKGEQRKELFDGHFSNMGRLAKQGKLVFAGPYSEAQPFRGLFIFNVDTIKEAESLVMTDPAVKAGIFIFEARKLYGSAALVLLNDLHKKVQKEQVQ